MNAIPAQVAGVERLVICAPTPGGVANPLVLLAARLSGVDALYRIGGAQAIAAMAYGTETIAPVDKITGPGNAYVAAAKRRVFGKVGIDMIAGPSEILVIADADNDPDWIAVDLLSQAEHDESAQSILITDDAAFGRGGGGGRQRACGRWNAAPIAGPSWRDYGAVIVVRDLSRRRRCRTGSRPSIWSFASPTPRRCSPDHPCRRRLPRPMDARGHRRLCRRAEPRPAHGTLGAVFLGPVGARLHEAHDAGADDPEALRAIGPAAETLAGRKALRRMGCRCARGWSD
jgi:hypothetical protein